ncbi:hypothetical protein, partial [Spongiimicrobium sp. 3-5]|uniref:hypothetical protein n=1 Tax=Spongiimicrobium sp. 3-5 TaxID=3332596 RepID=UPI00397ECCAE
MKLKFLLFAFAFCTFSFVGAQIKIGDNPQTIDAASVLELESGNRVLVITRASTVQMNNIAPLAGGMVYNTDTQCIHYYDGAQWLNLCEASNISLVDNGNNTYTFTDAANNTTDVINTTNASLSIVSGDLVLTDSDNNTVSTPLAQINTQTFTSNPGINPIETISIVQTGNNFNFEVTEITGMNIVDGTINGFADIQNGTVTLDKLQSGLPNQVIRTNGAGNLAEWATLDAANINGQDLTPTDASITINNGLGSTLVDADIAVTDLGITTAKLATDAVTIEKLGTAGIADANRVLGTDAAGDPQWQDAAALGTNLGADVTSTDGSITGVANDAALAAMDLQVNVDGTTLEVDPVNGVQIADDGVTTTQIGTAGIADANRVLGTDAAGDPQWQDAAALG